MTDTGNDGQIQQAENSTEPDWDADWQAELAEEETITQPRQVFFDIFPRWWFASTGFPLIAGTFGPMANAFNICALAQPWREKVPPSRLEGFGTQVEDPSYIIVVNAISLAFALIANTSLLLNMFGRVSFAIAQPITTIGFMMASLLLISILGVASSGAMQLHDLPHGYTQDHTQAFFYASFAAANYLLVSVLMNITVWGAIAGKYDKQFHITNSQKTLMLQTISYMTYLLVGAAIFSKIEGWRYNDAVYWAEFTLLTIGIGDRFVPVTLAGRILVIFYTFGGILAVGLVISSFRSMLLEKGAEKIQARSGEKKRQVVHTLDDAEWGRGHRLSWLLPKKKQEQKEMTDRERRMAEFHAMRRIQARFKKANKYRALALSLSNAALLWFLGSLVFFKVEFQNWTYFEAVYFSWVTLITLGYGDLQPKSNCGKAFFVFWTLLAIPTLTVLIGDLGDTVVSAVSNATNWVGSLTITPGDAEFFKEFRKNLNRITGRILFKSKQKAADKEDDIAGADQNKGRVGELKEMLEERLSDKEKADMDDFCQTSSETTQSRDTYLYHFLIMKEIRRVLADTAQSPPRQYTYDEWSYFLKLLGHDEADPAFQTQRYNTLKHGKRDDDDGPQAARILDHSGNPRHWSWLSLRSPLAGLTSEPQWILNSLLKKLSAELHFTGKPGRGIGDLPPPISLSQFRGYSTAQEMDGYKNGMNGKEVKRREATFA